MPEQTAVLQPEQQTEDQTQPEPKGDACDIVDREFIIQWFSPRWFIFIMGTGAIANVYQMLAHSATGLLHNIAVLFLLIAAIAFPVASVFKLWRLAAHFRCIAQEFTHSSLMQFYSAIPIAAAVISTGFLNIPIAGVSEGIRLALAQSLWWVSLVLSIGLVVLIPLRVILGEHAEPKRALGFWFLPPVGLFVLVFNGNFLAGHLSTAAAQAIFQLNTIVLGLALFFSVAVFTIFLFRAFFYKFPRPDVTPSYVIGLAPIGVSIIALNTYLPLYAKMAPAGLPSVETLGPMVGLLSLLLWGFGLWWLFVALAIVASKALTTRIPVTLGYWAFIFPPAAYTLSTLLLAGKFPFFGFLAVTGQALSVLIMGAWVLVAVLVAINTHTKRIFLLPPSFQDLNVTTAEEKAA